MTIQFSETDTTEEQKPIGKREKDITLTTFFKNSTMRADPQQLEAMDISK